MYGRARGQDGANMFNLQKRHMTWACWGNVCGDWECVEVVGYRVIVLN